jgi:hypothetical protein
MFLAGANVKKGFSYGATDEHRRHTSRAGCTRQGGMRLTSPVIG